MSHKIKILEPGQFKELTAGENAGFPDGVSVYFTTILPGLFYSVSDFIVHHAMDRFLYIAPERLGREYSARIFDNISYKKINLFDNEIIVDDNIFIPFAVEDIVMGGFYGPLEKLRALDRQKLLANLVAADYFGMIFNFSRDQEVMTLTSEILELISSNSNLDSFLKALAEWISDQTGGQVAFYYNFGHEYVLRKISGPLGEYTETAVEITGEDAAMIGAAQGKGKIFLPADMVPNQPTEIRYPPRARFILGGKIDNDLGYLLTGIMPSLTAYLPALFLENLSAGIRGLSDRHFGHNLEWHRLFAAVEEIGMNGRAPDELADFLLRELNRHMSLCRVSVSRYYPLESRLTLAANATVSGRSLIDTGANLPVVGSDMESLLETGRYRLVELTPNAMDNRFYYQLYREGTRSLIIIPIKGEESVFGFLYLGSVMPGRYLERFQQVFSTLAQYLAKIYGIINLRYQNRLLNEQAEQMELKLAALEKMRTLGELAGGVFHDLNNAIGAILGRSQLLLNKLNRAEKTPQIESFAQEAGFIEKSAIDSGQILNRLRQLAQTRRTIDLTAVNLSQIIEEAVEMVRPRWEKLARQKGLKLNLEKRLEEISMVMAEPVQLREVFTNIMLNALDAMPEGGTITIISRQSRDNIKVTFSDTGQGMEAETLSRIFEPFFTTKGEKGTGLGLPMSRKIIESHGGKIEVRSNPNQGTSFAITLPLLADTPAIPEASPERRLPMILFVESNSEFSSLMADIIESRGLELVQAKSGEEALQALGRERCQIVISDMGLPGISGLELAGQIKRADPEIKVILISGWEIEESVAEMMKKGVDAHLIRPFAPDSLIDTINNFLNIAPKSTVPKP